jgi:hypothetical protein
VSLGQIRGLLAAPGREEWVNDFFDTNVVLNALLDREP